MLLRREFCWVLSGALSLKAYAPPSVAKRYRADATVTFLGIPIFSRAGVGSGSIAVEQNAQTVTLRFQAGSAPDRARGLNRLGFIQEQVVEQGSSVVESKYFGFMTSSGEESLDQAKAALGASGKDAVPYTAVEGSASTKLSAYKLFQMKLPPSYDFSKCEEVVTRVRESIGKSEISPTRHESAPSETARTFLYALREAIRSSQSKSAVPFLYNGKQYRLEAEKSPDSKMGNQFAARKLTGDSARIHRLNGSIYNVTLREKTPFKLWYESGHDLPIRFEYKAKSYLNLVFEQS